MQGDAQESGSRSVHRPVEEPSEGRLLSASKKIPALKQSWGHNESEKMLHNKAVFNIHERTGARTDHVTAELSETSSPVHIRICARRKLSTRNTRQTNFCMKSNFKKWRTHRGEEIM